MSLVSINLALSVRNPIFDGGPYKISNRSSAFYCGQIQTEVNSTDYINNACVVLCCSLSLDDSSAKKSLKKIDAYLPSLNVEMLDSYVKKAIKRSILNILEVSSSNSKAVKTLTSVLKGSIKIGPHLCLRTLSTILKWDDPKFGSLKTIWSVLEEGLVKWSKEKNSIAPKKLQKLLGAMLPRMLEWFGTVSFSALTEFVVFESMLKTLLILLQIGKLDSVTEDVVFTNALIFVQLAESSDLECYTKVAAAIMDGIATSEALRESLWPQLEECHYGQHTYSSWFLAQHLDPHLLTWNFLARAPRYASSATQFDARKWVEKIFAFLPDHWLNIQKTESYTSLLSSISNTTFNLIINPMSGVNMSSLALVTKVCQSHLFSPHPLIQHLALDLWCLILRSSSSQATKSVAQNLGDLAKHFVETHFSSAPMTSEALRGLYSSFIRIRSIIRRVMESLPVYHRPDIDQNLKHFPIFLTLEGSTSEMGEADYALIDLLPWDLISNSSLLPMVLQQLLASLQRNQNLRPEPSVRFILCLRAIYRLIVDVGNKFTADTISSVSRALNVLLTSLKNSTVAAPLDGDMIATLIDIIASLRSHPNFLWKSPFINLSDRFQTFSPVAKIALLQFISSCLSDPNTSAKDASEINSAVVGVFERALADSEWSVVSEAIISYFTSNKHHSIKISKSSSVEAMNDSLRDPTPIPTSESALQVLRSALQESSKSTLLDSLIAFKTSVNQFAAQNQDQQRDGILQELAQLNHRLSQLESSLTSSSAANVTSTRSIR